MTTTPTFTPQQPAEGWTVYGRRALLFVLTHDVTFCVPDAAIESAADYAGIAAGAPMSDAARERIVGTGRILRQLLTGRRANAAAVAALDATAGAADCQTTPPTAPDGPQSDGGSRVRLVPPPVPQSPSTALQAPRQAIPAAVPAGRVPVAPQPVPVMRPVQPVAPVFSADLF